jgi:hypothetical protein
MPQLRPCPRQGLQTMVGAATSGSVLWFRENVELRPFRHQWAWWPVRECFESGEAFSLPGIMSLPSLEQISMHLERACPGTLPPDERRSVVTPDALRRRWIIFCAPSFSWTVMRPDNCESCMRDLHRSAFATGLIQSDQREPVRN